MSSLLLLLVNLLVAPPSASIPAGTALPLRFLRQLRSGKDTVGTSFVLQTMAALVTEGCVQVPAYTQVRATITTSRGPGWFGRHGELAFRVDSIEVRDRVWVPMHAVLDSLEYATTARLDDAGTMYGQRGTRARVGTAGAVAVVGAAEAVPVIGVPVAVLGGYELVRHGPRVRVLAGEVGWLRLRAPLSVPRPGCRQMADDPDLTTIPHLPTFTPRTGSRSGPDAGDPVNLVLFGNRPDLDEAFRRAGWRIAAPRSFGALAHELAAVITSRSAVTAPVSTQYFEGREQDAAYELAGPNARIRHHVRIWLLDSVGPVWIGAADEDVGLKVNPIHRTATHRIDSHIDRERDFIGENLEAGGCADVMTFMALPGSVAGELSNAAHQKMVTDGRAAIIHLRPCAERPGPRRNPQSPHFPYGD
jgi:hypothetical protein